MAYVLDSFGKRELGEFTVQGFWECECDGDHFIHRTDEEPECLICGACNEDHSDARVCDILDLVDLTLLEYSELEEALRAEGLSILDMP